MTIIKALLVLAIGLSGCASSGEPVGEGGQPGAGGAGDGDGGATSSGSFQAGGGTVCHEWQIESYLPGPDATLGTADDVLSGFRTVQEVDDYNVITRSVQLSSAGQDGVWSTADDVIDAETRTVPGEAADTVYEVSYNAPGPDGVWGTDDGVIVAASWAKLDASGRPIDRRALSAAGDDGQWLTADDPIDRRYTYSYGDGETAPRLLDLQSVSPGDDMVWGNDDDPVAIATHRYNSWGKFCHEAGPDGAWGTADDVIDSRYDDKRDWQGYKQYLTMFDAGPDLEHFTADDLQTGLAKSKCLGDAIDAMLMGDAGPDHIWDTSDDNLLARVRITGCANPCDSATPVSPVEPPE